MAEYDFNCKIVTDNFTIEVADSDRYGAFEHNDLGDECGGGLWFEQNPEGKLELIDADGTYTLPEEVAEALRLAGYVITEEFE